MEDAIINILIVNPSQKESDLLVGFLKRPGNNIMVCETYQKALDVFSKIEIGIALVSNETENINWQELIQAVSSRLSYSDCFLLATGIGTEQTSIDQLFQIGVTDFIEKPYSRAKILAKVNNFRRLYFKNRTIVNLLENILPKRVLAEFRHNKKYTPKKHQNCVILFTDFAEFSKKATALKPTELLKILDYYFTEFDSIFERYNIEKIKTIGDSYMAVAGLHKDDSAIEIKMALAALEVRNFIQNDIAERKAKDKDHWNIRIGIHRGDLIAGVIGRKKFTFDVWGDSVNIASRCEQHAPLNQINISHSYKAKIESYFNFTDRGKVKIKHDEQIEMYLLNNIKQGFRTENSDVTANVKLRKISYLPELDFEGIRKFVIETLNSELDKKLVYHSINHTLKVEEAALKYAKLEGIPPLETILLRTAALFHDTGFLSDYQHNETHAVNLLNKFAPDFGYSTKDIAFMKKLILATAISVKPQNIFEQILCDADHDYLGRKDYHITAKHLRKELATYGQSLTDELWLKKQINYLENEHTYYTNSAINLRQTGKEKRIEELRKMLALLNLKK